MNLVQVILKARRATDAILPSGQVSSLWGDDEMVDLVTEANEELNLRFRLVKKHWHLKSVLQTDPPFSMDGEVYVPATELVLASQLQSGTIIAPRLTLPPDFGEMVRILCISNRTVRFVPAPMEWTHFIDLEQGSYSTFGSTVIPSTPEGLCFYYDIVGNRTMIVIPPTTTSFNIGLDYIPTMRPLYYTNVGTIELTNGSTHIAGTGTIFQTAGLFSEASGQACELIVGTDSLTDTSIQLGTDYLRVATITSDITAELVSPYTGPFTPGTKFILAMAPTLPRVYHRWLARLVAANMLSKVSPQLATEYAQGVMQKFAEVVQPSSRVRQSQDSQGTEDAEEFGSAAAW